jgi:hypothetical protein
MKSWNDYTPAQRRNFVIFALIMGAIFWFNYNHSVNITNDLNRQYADACRAHGIPCNVPGYQQQQPQQQQQQQQGNNYGPGWPPQQQPFNPQAAGQQIYNAGVISRTAQDFNTSVGGTVMDVWKNNSDSFDRIYKNARDAGEY